jgi:hypothetical protein
MEQGKNCGLAPFFPSHLPTFPLSDVPIFAFLLLNPRLYGTHPASVKWARWRPSPSGLRPGRPGSAWRITGDVPTLSPPMPGAATFASTVTVIQVRPRPLAMEQVHCRCVARRGCAGLSPRDFARCLSAGLNWGYPQVAFRISTAFVLRQTTMQPAQSKTVHGIVLECSPVSPQWGPLG